MDVLTLPLPPSMRSKLLASGFLTTAALVSVTPFRLAQGSTTAWDLLMKEKGRRRIGTGSEEVDKILGGGILSKELTEICGDLVLARHSSGCSVPTPNSWSLITPKLSSSRTVVCSASRRFLPVTSHTRRARTKFSIAATPNEGDETEDPVTSSTSMSVSEETETFPTTPNSISDKRAKAEAEVKKGQRTAIVTGVISVLLGVGYLVLIQLLDTRGVILVPPPPEAFDP